jgi:hypothetical protein
MASPFAVRSFRFQWPADLATSWAFEMEALILGWYILTATGSVTQLAAVAALAWLGSIFSPFFGLAGDRIGHRAVLCITRSVYALLAAVMTALTLSDALEPWHVFAIAAAAGLLRPSDMVMRSVLVGQTIRAEMLMGALGLSRTTSDTARVAGALAGAGGVALIGMGAAYVIVTAMYVVAVLLTPVSPAGPASPVRGRPQGRLCYAHCRIRRHVCHGVLVISSPTRSCSACCPVADGLRRQTGIPGYLASYGPGLGRLAHRRRWPSPAGAAHHAWSAGFWFAATLLFGQTSTLAIGMALPSSPA